MRSASTDARTEEIYSKLQSAQCKAFMALYRWDGTNWVYVEDIDVQKGIDITKSAKKNKYASFLLTPQASTISFNVLNRDGEYSPGSGTSKDNAFTLDTKIKVKGGYRLSEPVTDQVFSALLYNDTYGKTFYTKYVTDGIVLDMGNTDQNTDKYFTDLFTIGNGTYADYNSYTPAGYFYYYFDMLEASLSKVVDLNVICNSTNGTIYYRLSNSLATGLVNNESTYWTKAASTSNGTQTITISKEGYRYLEMAVIVDGVSWTDPFKISSITMSTLNYIEWIYEDVFYLDSPSFNHPKKPNLPMIKCSGRDLWKRAVEGDINLPTISGKKIDQLIKDICDKRGLKYSTTSIADLSAISDRTLSGGLTDKKSVEDIFEWCMQVATSSGTFYQMYLEYDSTEDDNVLFVQPFPSVYQASYILSDDKFESIGDTKIKYDDLLKTINVYNESGSVLADVQLGTANYTTTGVKTINWAGNAAYKDIDVTVNSGNGDISSVSLTPTSATFTVTGTTFDIDVTVRGSKWSDEPSSNGEYINWTNLKAERGIDVKIENPLLITTGEAKNVADQFGVLYGMPDREANNIKFPYLNLLLEQNDVIMPWSYYLFLDDLYFLTGIKMHWDWATRPGDFTAFNLRDAGINFSDLGDFIYDRDKFPVSGVAMKYDYGYKYDMVYGVRGKESDVNQSKYRHDIAFV